jgi:TPR repeat protein
MPEAEFVMAQYLTENLVVPRDEEAAYRWLKMAADSGFAPAADALPRFEKLRAMRAASDSGQAGISTHANPGLVFIDVVPDTTTAKNDSLLLREAIQNAGPALRRALGMTKMLEEELRTDSATLAAIGRASEAGSPEALTVLGRLYEKGTGVTKDIVRACALYIRAIRLDSPRAPELLWSLLQEKSTLSGVKVVAGKNDPEAQFVLAGLSALGFDGVLAQAHSYLTGEQAFLLLTKAADRGYLAALVEMGLCYYGGRWVPASTEKALGIWRDASGRGSQDARVRIALTELRATGDTLLQSRAVSVLGAASDEGSVLAETGLGYCHETGKGFPPSKARAARYYRAASVRGSQDAYHALRRMHDAIRPDEPQFRIAD